MNMGFRKRLFAWMLKKGESINRKLYGPYKQSLFHDLKGSIVEIGPGTGINFNYLPSGISWIGIEPNEAFHEVLLSQAKENGIQATLLVGEAGHIPIADNSADGVICTLVLCTVKDPAAAILEMKRVLKPGGKLVFIEHVAAPKETFLRLVQDSLNPLNRLVADGCNCNRETWRYIQQAGFTRVELAHHKLKGPLKFHAPHIMGLAVK
jgi:ubiquinone/menaquinone biosynthesis C-methylase UbiE